ncbi:fibronectin type III domain-containing protein [Hippea maritima]|uniref:Fibronectin type III domain protein n=1 Tax=Hippea maritima (strain ATCC 700847 / DSM 10411 / MH2) TaxID=760142 RepID=F2LW53_HIPMA|nr:fibronectin type III domain-containing protein [Hippea maritima]AEA33987.1 Fibronectin type III domain protein [Hippea maritima DSM 10411]
MKRAFLFLLVFIFMWGCIPQTKQTVITSLPIVEGLKTHSGIRSVGLSWKPVLDKRVKGYVVFRSSSPTGEFKQITKISNKLKTTYEDTGGFLKHLEDNAIYYYKIAVYSDSGIGPSSQVVEGKTLPPPNSPKQISATSGLARMVVIKWYPPQDDTVVAYNIYRSINPKGPFKKVGRVNGYVNTIYIDKGLKDGSTYYYSVVSVNYKGVEGDILAVAKATTKFKPAPPRNLSAKPSGAGKLTIYWWPSITADVVKYRIYRGSTKGSLGLVGEVPSDNLSYIDSGLSPGKTYYYYLTSVDKDGIESLPTKIYSFETKPLPEPPTGISVKQVGHAVVISWSKASPDTVKYEVFRRHFVILTRKIAETENTYYTDNEVSPNTTYYYYIKAVDKYGQESPPSPEVKIKVR